MGRGRRCWKKEQILTLLKDRPLSNQEIRQMTGRTAQQVRSLMAEMEEDGVTYYELQLTKSSSGTIIIIR